MGVVVVDDEARIDDAAIPPLEPVPGPFAVLATRQVGAEGSPSPQARAERAGAVRVAPAGVGTGEREILLDALGERLPSRPVAIAAGARHLRIGERLGQPREPPFVRRE